MDELTKMLASGDYKRNLWERQAATLSLLGSSPKTPDGLLAELRVHRYILLEIQLLLVMALEHVGRTDPTSES